MSLFNLPWKWDYVDTRNSGVEGVPGFIHIRRWHRGPVTFYRYDISSNLRTTVLTQWWLCVADDVSFGVHLPDWANRMIEKAGELLSSTPVVRGPAVRE